MDMVLRTDIAVTIVVAVLLGVLQAYSARILATTLWAGRAIAPADSETVMPTGVQDRITPPWQTRLHLGWMIGFVALVIVCSLHQKVTHPLTVSLSIGPLD
jgi:hypothetical protein